MLGRTCLRHLQASRPYVCQPCLRTLRAAPPARPLDAFCAARRFHAVTVLHAQENADPPEDKLDEANASRGDKKNAPKKGKNSKARRREARKQAAEARKHGESPSKVRRILSSPGREENSDSPGAVENSSADDQGPQAEDGSETSEANTDIDAKEAKRAEKRARHAARLLKRAAKAEMQKQKKKAGKNLDIGQVLERVAGNGAAEVLAAAAKTDRAQTLKAALLRTKKHPKKRQEREFVDSVLARDVQLTPIDVEQPPIPQLAYGLDRVLFNPGVYHLQDTRTQVYNFDPYLQKIMPVADFNFDLLKKYITSSQDETLSNLARSLGKRYVGSTSSMTAVLAHFHFLLSRWRELNLTMLSKGFSEQLSTFTRINRLPAAIFLRWQNGTYAIDADKQYDTANILSMLGRSMEKLLTLPMEEFERYRRGSPDQVSDEEREVPESYHYTTQGDMLMRSQLDAQDNRLPGTGMFDLKTRAVVSIRMDVQDWEENTGYQIKTGTGNYESFEREYYDMMRSTMLKYSLQVRMGRMDGIFVAYHNIERIFGFQYVSLDDMDMALHNPASGTRHLGDQEFRLSVDLLNKVLNMATERFPETSIRFHFETREGVEPFMYIFAQPMPEEEVRAIQESNKARTEAWERKVLGLTSDETSEGADREDREDVTLRVANQPTVPEHQAVDVVALPELFEIPEEEPQWSSLAPQVQPEALENKILEETVDSDSDITADQPKEEPYSGPLLALKLWTRNKINGESVGRVKDVREDTDWTVDYQFEELSPSDGYKRYHESKRRRAVGLADPEIRKEGLEEEEKVLSFYQRKLREMSKSGREWREQKDEEEKGKDKVVLEPLGGPKVVQPTEPQAKEPVSVEGYMSWLYKKRE
ncbi:Mitochondrial protein Pet127 [Lasiodiplodia theobromae]|uniref:mRNA degradation protein n=1 Tax=Lasiodiplodia theobromae TaxID=45133 RepID=A0A5N5DGM8_9PEZI|nr:Mitochondrial protein [Lasiodiplodia theobromae]KAB2576989.1 mRNA degradation protein [Lasiodiplodia theobromae]KAF4543618.1 Mitochondrial protein [Lasiodiplodia theobromae]KAF9631351.1 Mitochondrial protein Pet127 [Lasiodiplodia theobromae]